MDAQKRYTKIGFLQKCQKSKFKRKNAYMSSPLTHIALRRAPCNKVNGAYYEPDTPVMPQRDALKFIALQILLADSIIDELEKAARLWIIHLPPPSYPCTSRRMWCVGGCPYRPSHSFNGLHFVLSPLAIPIHHIEMNDVWVAGSLSCNFLRQLGADTNMICNVRWSEALPCHLRRVAGMRVCVCVYIR